MANPPQWIQAFLQERRYAVLATCDDDGSVHLTPVWYLLEDGKLYVGTSSTSRKARNIEARPTASLVVDARKLGTERWVSASGQAGLLRGQDAGRIHDKILRRYLTDEALNHPVIGPGMAASDDVVIRIQALRWRSWDLKSLDDQFFGGLLTQTPEKWFRPIE